MVEVVGGEDAGIEVALAHETDVFEAGLEVRIGHGAGVLEFTQDGIIEAVEVAIRDEVFQGTATVVGFAVLRVREPAEEIFHAVVERVIDEVMTVTEIRFAFAVKEDLAFSVENLAHEDMAGFVSFPTIRRGGSVPSTDRFSAPRGGVIVRYFLPAGIKKKGATFVRPKVKTRVFAIASGQKPKTVEWSL